MKKLTTNQSKLCPDALNAAMAARNWHIWGAYAARRFAEHRGVPSGLLTLARVLANTERAGL